MSKDLDKKICRAAGWSYSNGYAFEKHSDKLNCTHRLMALKELMLKMVGEDEHVDGTPTQRTMDEL